MVLRLLRPFIAHVEYVSACIISDETVGPVVCRTIIRNDCSLGCAAQLLTSGISFGAVTIGLPGRRTLNLYAMPAAARSWSSRHPMQALEARSRRRRLRCIGCDHPGWRVLDKSPALLFHQWR